MLGGMAIASAVGMTAGGSGAALAACGGPAAVDRCLIGGWATDGGGMAEWLGRNMPAGFPLPQPDTGGAVTFNEDGTYRAVPNDPALGGGSSGRWSAAEGRLQMCESERIGAPPAGAPPIPGPTGEALDLAYRCAADMVETRLRIPPFDDPLVTTYSRVGADSPGGGGGQ